MTGPTSPTHESLAAGAVRALPRQVGPYTLFESVGRGGMAELFVARAETELGATRRVVVKVILPQYSGDSRFAEMLAYEAKLASRLSHRHIVQVLDLGRHADELYIAMEYVEGFDLNALLRMCTRRGVGLPVEHALGIVSDVLSALDYAHTRRSDAGAALSIVHRDVSPSNVLISFDGEVKLCDFGIAHASDVLRERPLEAFAGKAGYMSPEHAHQAPVDARSDVFAAGIVLWELLAGKRLYVAREGASLLDQAREAHVPPIPYRGLPDHDDLARIVARALMKEPADRYPSAAAFGADLEGYLVRAGLVSSRLRLGDWLATTFGTELIEQRLASERRLPKSVPPQAYRPSSRPPSVARVLMSAEYTEAPVRPSPQEPTEPLVLPGLAERASAQAGAWESAQLSPSAAEKRWGQRRIVLVLVSVAAFGLVAALLARFVLRR